MTRKKAAAKLAKLFRKHGGLAWESLIVLPNSCSGMAADGPSGHGPMPSTRCSGVAPITGRDSPLWGGTARVAS